MGASGAGGAESDGARAGRARLVFLLAIAVGLATAAFLLTLGPQARLPATVRAVLLVERLALAGVPALAYVVAGIGIGRLWRGLLRGSAEAGALQAALGVATLLWLSHLLGWLGVLTPWVAIGVIGVGLALALEQLVRVLRVGVRLATWRGTTLAAAPAAAVLVVASASTPGWLWMSEFGGYDALSYHLQLPREWLEAGRLTTLEHNVYSALPSFVEAAFMHVGAALTPTMPLERGGLPPLVGEAGMGLLSCQMLHGLLTLLAAWCVGRAAAAWGARLGLGSDACGWAGAVASGLVIATPWTVVVGSLAYNETPMLLMGAAAMIVALEPTMSAWRKGLLAGVLMGAACGVKPTALLMLAPGMALVLALHTTPREWYRVAIAGGAAGMVMLGPWLARNALATGNPVFPFAAAVFANEGGGTGHWSAEQVARFKRGHSFDGGVADRLRLAILPEPRAGQPAEIARYRGMSNPQWGVFFGVAAGAIAIGAVARRAASERAVRGAFVTLAAFAGLSLLAWLFATHVQSRFLLPLLLPGAVGVGLLVATLRGAWWRWAACGLVGVQALVTVSIMTRERDGNPLGGVDYSAGERTGVAFREILAGMDARGRGEMLSQFSAEAFVNLAVPPEKRVVLVGDATPLFYLRRVSYSTTWDTSMMSAAVAANPGDAAAWSRGLREAGVDVCVVNMGEIARLSGSGFADPGLTARAIEGWMRTQTRPVMVWPQMGVFVVEPGGPVGTEPR